MVDWFLASFREDTVEWISIFVALALSLVFRQWLWRLLKLVWVVVSWPFRQIAKLRITTASRVIPRQKEMVVPARWTVVQSEALADIYGLKNTSVGSVATNVRLEVAGPDAQLVSGAAWRSLSGGEVGEFEMRTRSGARVFGLVFVVIWDDANGATQVFEFRKGGLGEY